MTGYVEFIEEHLLGLVVTVIWLFTVLKLYLGWRQRTLMLQLVDWPSRLENIMSEETYNKCWSYDLDKLNFANVNEIYMLLYNLMNLLFHGYRRFWQWGTDTAVYIGYTKDHEILISTICVFYMSVVFELFNLPMKIYHVFFLEEKHGFNKQKALFFVKDQLLKFLVMQVIALPLTSAVIWIVKNGGDYLFFYLWVFSVLVTLFIMIIYPEVIAPLFDKYTPLPEGDLKKKIEALASSVNFPLYKLFIVEGSKRSSHSNAYLYGFHKHKRIVLFDTLVKEYYKPADGTADDKGCETDEVLAVLAHEIGHWKYSHTLKGFLLSQVNFIVSVLIYVRFLEYTPLFVACGFTDSKPTFIGLILVSICILLPFNTVMELVVVTISRRFEFEADKFACILGHGEPLKRALIKLQKDNLAFPFFDKLYAAWHHSHPQFFERLDAIDKHQ